MNTAPLVSDLVTLVLEASTEALRFHHERLFAKARGFEQELEITRRLERGDLSDLADAPQPGGAGQGFAHAEVSQLFRNLIRPFYLSTYRERSKARVRRGIDRHIWGADADRKMFSLFPTGAAAAREFEEEEDGADRTVVRTRVSACVQHALLRNRRVFQADKATTSRRDPGEAKASVFIPSPYAIAAQILTDPEAQSTESYALAALRTDLVGRLASGYPELKFDYETISRGLDTIYNRVSTSKPTRLNADPAAGETQFLCHYLAMTGILSVQVRWDQSHQRSRVDRLLRSVDNLFDVRVKRGEPRGLGLGVGFRLHPDFASLPEAGELLNALRGLPLPIEGAETIFHGGLRFSAGGDIVAAVSGPFGAGKTSACLSLAAALAPLGCRTLFLSCEEAADDIEARLGEAAPETVSRSTPLFNCVSLDEVRDFGKTSTWFRAHKLRLEPNTELEVGETIDVAAAVQAIIERAIRSASIFRPFFDEYARAQRPSFARRVIIIDGFHQLFRESDTPAATVERSLRALIDFCRGLEAVVIFTVAESEPAIQRLDYLCDLVIQLDREGFDRPDSKPTRIFRLLKARRQPALPGAHIFHLAGPKSFRIKPSVRAHAQQARVRRWIDPDLRTRIQLADEWTELKIRNRSQVLIYGKGSSGKAGLGLYILHRRAIEDSAHTSQSEPSLFDTPVGSAPFVPLPPYEARVLVISFLYQSAHYRQIHRKLRHAPRKRPAGSNWIWWPDSSIPPDVVSLYPGSLTPEDFLAKIENRLAAAELRGLAYTGVLIDGIHNVFVQYPALEADTAFWPQLYSLLRRRGVTVVTTHTDFELREYGSNARSFDLDFEHAQRKAAPLLSALVSAADYVFEISAEHYGPRVDYNLHPKSALGEDPPAGFVSWDRTNYRLGEWNPNLIT